MSESKGKSSPSAVQWLFGVFGLVTLYVLGVGPVHWLHAYGMLPYAMLRLLGVTIYAPLVWLEGVSPTVQEWLLWYVLLFSP